MGCALGIGTPGGAPGGENESEEGHHRVGRLSSCGGQFVSRSQSLMTFCHRR